MKNLKGYFTKEKLNECAKVVATTVIYVTVLIVISIAVQAASNEVAKLIKGDSGQETVEEL